METEISFLSETYEIEGLLEKNSPEQGVIVTHPHPLYGGDMYNPVVDTLVAAYQQKGYDCSKQSNNN
jgi:alpha/beta superfamily hydrolase